MKKPLLLLLFLLFCLGLLAVVVSLNGSTPVMATELAYSQQNMINIAEEAFNAANPIFTQLQKTISDNMSFLNSTLTSQELNIEGAEAALNELEITDAEAELEKLSASIRLFDEVISRLTGLPDDLVTSEGKTVHAVLEYLTMLRNMASDMTELCQYSIDLYRAILPLYQTVLPVLNMDENLENYKIFSERLTSASLKSQKIVEKITPPAYLDISHGDIVNWLTVFQVLSQDFSTAVQMDDPLRIYSCIYRTNRVSIMFLKCYENLRADIELQLKQAENRINGPILLLHDELSKNLSLLKSAY